MMVEQSRSRSAIPGPFEFISRRRFLKAGLVGGSVLLMGGGGMFALRGIAPDVKGLKCLSAHEFRTLTALAKAHIPTGGIFREGAKDFGLPRLFDDFLSNEPAENRAQLKLALLLVEYGPVLFERRLKTFSWLPPVEQQRHWESWVLSPRLLQRQISVAFRKFFSLVFYDQSAIWKYIGYPGPSLGGATP